MSMKSEKMPKKLSGPVQHAGSSLGVGIRVKLIWAKTSPPTVGPGVGASVLVGVGAIVGAPEGAEVDWVCANSAARLGFAGVCNVRNGLHACKKR